MADDIRAEEWRAWDAMEAGAYFESARLFEPLAALGSETALLSLGWMHSQGHLGPPDLEKAISLWETAERAGSVKAKLDLGWAWKKKGDLQRARAIYLEGAEQGYTPCMCGGGKMLVRGEGGEADFPAGVAWLTRAADSGHVFARRELMGLAIRDAPSLWGRLFLYCKMIWFVLGTVPRYVREPYADDFR